MATFPAICRGMKKKQLIVVGGGAAGFFCAVNAARLCPELKVAIVEKGSRVLQKVGVSGGGRCNVTHACDSVTAMSKCYPRGEKFVKKAFHHFFVQDTIAWFAHRGVALKTEEDGRMFPVTNSSQTVIDCLLREANKYGVDLLLNFPVMALHPANGGWQVLGSQGRSLEADFLCIACGGFPKPEQFGWLTSGTGHRVVSPLPSLFTFNVPRHPLTALMGIAVPRAIIRIAGTKLESEGPVLITHWGLSGPAVLRTSAFGARVLAEKGYQYKIHINWLPEWNETSLRELIIRHRQQKGQQKVVNTDWLKLPQRLLLFLMQEAGIAADSRWTDVPAAAQNKWVKSLCSYEMDAHGKTTFRDEFVTAGGIELAEVDSSTMRSRLHPQLYFAGEILDVDGITGGYNFQHAWTSGFIAADNIARACIGGLAG
jgi:predicted Rossmann fold flavoprotein